MSAIEEWLASLGLGEYASRFAENDIDFTILSDLTDQDLEKIGVASLGHRRKILRAIAALDGSTAANAQATPTPAAAPPASAPIAPTPPRSTAAEAASAAERRYLTVMFCDLVGSTGIAAKLDAEEWRDLVGAYLDAASAAVTEMGGHVAKKLGDGLLALFGYPVAQENDAERAARAALSIQRALAELNRENAGSGKPELTARIGLEAGPVVVDAAGEIFGDAPNVAARVQALAEPGAVLITARVQRQVSGLFVAEERGSHTLKGVSEPTVLYRLMRASGGRRRSAQRNLTPLVGREDEMTTLMRRWQRARQGEGQLVLIVGEPGLGKSRLIEEFHSRLADSPHTWVEWSCSQLLQNTPLHPIAEWGRVRFGGADVPAERRLADLESSLVQVKLDPAEIVPLLAPLLDMPLPRERMPALAPEELRRRQLAALTNWVIAGAKAQPVVLAFEDLHWADPTTLDVLRAIAEQGALAPLFIVATARPEFRPSWSMRSHHGTISLAPLDRAQVRDMVAELSAQHALPKDVVEDVAARTGGVPLFVEEVTRLLLERGGEGGIHAIPPTLQQSLMARLDRLGPAREVAQIGSVIGRGFSYGLLRDVAGIEDAPLQAALEKLAEADIVLVQGLPPESDYRFKHALIQDAAYENLLKSRRQVLHRRVAEILRDRFADTAAAEPEVLAHHFTQAGMTDAAIEWWGKAGDQALRRSAFQEAIAHLGKAIEMADKAGEAAPRAAAAVSPTSQRLKLQTSYGQAMMWSKGYAAPETAAAFARAQELAAGGESTSERFVTYYGQWGVRLLSADFRAARETAEIMLREAGSRTPEALAGHRLVALTSLCQGNFVDARTHSEMALQIDDSSWDRDAKLRFGQDSHIAAFCYLGLSRWTLGDIESAREHVEMAIANAVASAHVPTVTNTYYFAAVFYLFRGDAEAVLRVAKPAVELSREHALSLYLAVGSALLGWAHARLGDPETGATELGQALRDLAEQGNKLWLPLYQGLLAQVESDARDQERASATIDEALALANQIGGYWANAFLHRIRGEILLKRDPANTAPAEEAFITAITVAQQQKARSFELRAALSLAKLYQSDGRAADAHAVVAPALEGFAPTPEFPEIERAQTLLAALAETDEVKNVAEARQRRLKLQTSYAQATMLSRGFGAEETKTAFARARELATQTDADERFDTYYGLWIGSFLRGEMRSARESAEAFLREANSAGRPTEAAVAHRNVGLTCLFQGDFEQARANLEQVLRSHDPERDCEVKFRFASDNAVSATVYLGLVEWQLGNFGSAREFVERAVRLAAESNHPSTLANAYAYGAIFAMIRGNAAGAQRAAEALIKTGREYGTALYSASGAVSLAWSRARLGDRETGIAELRQALAAYIDQGNKLAVPFQQGLLAQLEAETPGREQDALVRIDEALALAEETGEHWTDAFLHRIRGEILFKRDPVNSAPAEEAFLTAIAIAQQQKARSFELRAALSLAKLYQSTARAADAHAVLAPALEGFAPTPEFPEIEQAQALLAALAQSDEMKTEVARRQRRFRLQNAYSNALLHGRGMSPAETTAAFAKARELAAAIEDSSERFSTYYGLWVGPFIRGNLVQMREVAEAFMRDAERRPGSPEAGIAHRLLGTTCWYTGDYAGARLHLEKALAACDHERDLRLSSSFGYDQGVLAKFYLGMIHYAVGKIDRGVRLVEESLRVASHGGHIPTIALARHYMIVFAAVRRDLDKATPHAQALLELGVMHDLPSWHGFAKFTLAWAGRWENPQALEDMRAALALQRDMDFRVEQPLFGTLLAEAEAAAGELEVALSTVNAQLAAMDQTGERWFEAEVHRARGEILLKRDPTNSAPAEEAFLTAIAIAQQQKARSFELRAALSLAKLYQSTARAAEAHAALAPALEGFSPTPEFPEIAEAQALLATLAQDDQVREALAKQHARAKLHIDYARAVQWGKGFAADETKAAFARAGELAVAAPGAPEYWALMYGRFRNFLMRGEFVAAHEAAASYLQQAEVAGRLDHVVNARRLLGTVKLELGAFQDSREEFEALLANWDEDRDSALRAVTGADVLCVGWAYMAQTLVCLGEVEAAVRMSEDAIRCAEALDDFGARAFALTNRLQIDAVRGRPDAMREPAEALRKLVAEKGTPLWELNARGYAIWARDPAQLDPAAAANEFGEIIAAKLERKELMRTYHWHGLLAQLQSAAGACEDALVSIAKGLEIAGQTGGHCKDSYLYRVRGDILAKRDAAAAEAAYHEALRIAREQGARTFELQAALSLAKLYQSTGRAADAHAVLAPALEGFSPTPEFPEIAEAQALLATLQS